jgi:hypothetical protein
MFDFFSISRENRFGLATYQTRAKNRKNRKRNIARILTWKTVVSTQLDCMWYAILNSNPGGKSCRLKGTFHVIFADVVVASV